MALAAVVSLMQTLDEQIKLHSDQPQSLLSKKEINSFHENLSFLRDFLERSSQTGNEAFESLEQKIRKSFHENLSFLRDFLEHSSQTETGNEAMESLERKIRNAAYAAQHIIESHISNYSESAQCLRYQLLHKIIQETDSITKEVMKNKEKYHLLSRDSLRAHLSKLAYKARNAVLGFQDELTEMKDRITSDSTKLNIVTIHGMDGCGKTTLAAKIFNDSLIEYQFPIRAWIKVSREYSEREILVRLLDSIKPLDDDMREASEDQLAEHLYKSLKGRKYFIVIDNVRDTKVWKFLRRLLPNDNEGSRVLITTPKSKVVEYVGASTTLRMSFLSTYGSHAMTLALILLIA